MKINKIFGLFVLSILLCCITSCKKSNTNRDIIEEDKEIIYQLSNELFPNPERGFMKTLIVFSEGESLNLPQLKLLKGQNISLVLRVFYLDKFKNGQINSNELSLIENDLNKIREAGIKAIIRFAYTDDVNGTDAPLVIVEQHLDQLKAIFEINKDVIAFVQAGFIGAYGEWHSSSNGLTTVENQRKVLLKLLSVLPSQVMVQVRTPGIKQQIFETALPVNKEIAYSTENRSRVGHHNDCFLSGGTDYGTYSNISEEKKYISDEALYVPTGGETCPPTGGYLPDCFEGQREMKLLKLTYLNLDYYLPTIAAWKSSGCFDEFQKNLGYRLSLVSAKFPNKAFVNTSAKISINISNRGYAPLYNKKNVSLVLKNKTSGLLHQIALSVDIRDCKPNVNFTINETVNLSNIPSGDYGLYLKIADQAESLKDKVEYSVRMANLDVWVEENGGINDLKSILQIEKM